MAEKAALNQLLLDTITSMEEAGLVNDRFRLVYSLKEANGPFFIAELLPTFCSDSQITITEMTQALAQPVVDFHEMEELCMKIKGATACIGALQIALACGDLCQAIDDRSKDRVDAVDIQGEQKWSVSLSEKRCTVAVDAIRHEFFKLQSKMDTILQLETRIISHN